MTYQWKIPNLMPVDAQTAGETLKNIYDRHGELKPSTIVDESRDEKAPLHKCFEWDDTTAAEKYRETQAGHLMRLIVQVSEETHNEPVRAFVHVEESVKPINVVLESSDMTKQMLQQALRELRWFAQKYRTLKQLTTVIEAIDQLSFL